MKDKNINYTIVKYGETYYNRHTALTPTVDTVDSRYFEIQGALWNTSRYPYLDISDLQNWGKNNSNNHI